MADEREISQRYRELAREEPPRHVDDAILAAARRAEVPRARRWYIPLAAAAVLVLAVAVALQVDRGEPDPEAPASAPPPPSAEVEEQRATPERKRESFTPDPKPAPSEENAAAAAGSRESRAERQDAPLRDLLKAPTAEPASPEPSARAKLSAKIGGLESASPEQWLQGIMDLRRQARDVEADQQLAEFRKRYPDYRIDEATMRKLSLP